MASSLLSTIRIIKDFPKKGINFYDIGTLLAQPIHFNKVINRMIRKAKQLRPSAIAGIDSRGFLFASIIAYKLGIKLIIIRKKGKLPGDIYSSSYKLEYGSNTLQIQKKFLTSKDRVLLVDDIFATSGTLNASSKLIEKNKSKIVGALVLLELAFLDGRKKFKYNLESLEKVNI